MLRSLLSRLSPSHLFSGGAETAVVDPQVEMVVPAEAAVVPGESSPMALKPAVMAGAWSADRVAIAESLWGEGFLSPGGSAEVMRLAVPLGATAASTMLLVGLGAGGPPRVLATGVGAWISGYDADQGLVQLARARINREGPTLAKRASAALWTDKVATAKPHSCHHGVMLDGLRGADPAGMLAGVAGMIRPGGQLAMMELVAEASDPAIDAWRALERRRSPLPREADITACLTSLGLEVRVVEDQSPRHIRQTLRGWQTLVHVLDSAKPSPAQAALLVMEAEIWLRRLRLIEAGQVRMMRWSAIVRGGAIS
jgi:hypothetical protein